MSIFIHLVKIEQDVQTDHTAAARVQCVAGNLNEFLPFQGEISWASHKYNHDYFISAHI